MKGDFGGRGEAGGSGRNGGWWGDAGPPAAIRCWRQVVVGGAAVAAAEAPRLLLPPPADSRREEGVALGVASACGGWKSGVGPTEAGCSRAKRGCEARHGEIYEVDCFAESGMGVEL